VGGGEKKKKKKMKCGVRGWWGKNPDKCGRITLLFFRYDCMKH
jgi:hypothetical protein